MTENRLDMADFARAMARRGLREDALLILDMMPGEPSVETLDLRARILTQLGRYAEAADVWRTVQEQCPEHEGAGEGLKMVAALRKSPLRRLRLTCALQCGRVAAVCLILALTAVVVCGVAGLGQRLQALGDRQDAIAAELTAVKDGGAAQTTTVLRDISSVIDVQLQTSERLSELQKKVERKIEDSAVARAKAATTAHKETLARFSQTAGALKREVLGARDSTQAEIDKLKGAQAATAKTLREKIAALQAQQSATAEALASLAKLSGSSGEALGKSLQGLSGTLDGIRPTLAALGAADGKQTAAIAAVQKGLAAQLDELGQRIDTLVAADPGKRIADLSGQYIQLRASLSSQTKKTEELASQLQGLGPKLAALGKAAEALEKRLAASVPTPVPGG